MVILLDGSSGIGRTTIAENAVALHPEWKHLALEVIAEAIPDDPEQKDFHLQVIKKCAVELEKDNMHLLLTMPTDAPQRDLLVLALKPNCITVHLGTDEEKDYDYVIDPATRSVNDVTSFLDHIMQPSDSPEELS